MSTESNFDVIVIGGGPGGYVAAIRAAQLGFHTALVEKTANPGGTCLSVGCIPSKFLLHASEIYLHVQHAKPFGIHAPSLGYNFSEMMRGKEKVIENFQKGIFSLFKKNKVTWIHGTGSFQDVHSITVDKKKKLTAKYFIIATGSVPTTIPSIHIDEKHILSSTGALSLRSVPETLGIIGAGVIGVELGSVYARLGAKVHCIEYMDRICPGLDRDVANSLQKELTVQGIEFHLSTQVMEAKTHKSKVTVSARQREKDRKEMEFDRLLVVVGRKPNTDGLGLENVHIPVDKKGYISVNSCFQTTHPNIYAIGDVIPGPMLAHKASEEGVIVAENMAGKNTYVDYPSIPNVIYTYPEVATVGVTEEELKTQNIEYISGKFPFMANSRAGCTGMGKGFVKLLVAKKGDYLLGMHLIGPHVGELISLGSLIIRKRLTVHDLIDNIYPHPTLSEAIKEAALNVFKRSIHI